MQVLRLPLVQAKACQVERDRPLVENSHDHLFAVDGRNGVHAKIDPLVAGAQGDGTVLRNALLGDVHFRQHLESRNDHDEDALRRRRQLVEHAVDAQPELAAVLERLQVDVAGTIPQRLLEYLVDHPDDPAVGIRGRRHIEVEDILIIVVTIFLKPGEIFGPLADGLGVASGAIEHVQS